jgi:aldehyde dehydrogenase (NAD+)
MLASRMPLRLCSVVHRWSTSSSFSAVRCFSSSSASNRSSDLHLDTKFPSPKADKNPMFRTELFINNEFVKSVDGDKFATINPGNGEVIADVSQATARDVDIAVSAAAGAFDRNSAWRNMTPRERGQCLYRLADLVEQNRVHLAELESLDNGKPLWNSMNIDVPACATVLRYFAGWADKMTGKNIPIGSSHLCLTHHEPVGVCTLIIPWNLPLIGVAAKLGPSLACGNAVVLKSAEQTPLSALGIASLVEEAGFPPGVVNILSGDGKTTGTPLVRHPLVNKIAFTGSTPVGKFIAGEAAAQCKRTTMELGGKNPVIVFADADLDLAVETIHNGLFWNDGEACAASTRIFVEDAVYDEFVRRSTEKAAQRTVGNPFHEGSQQGAQVSTVQMEKILGYVEGAVKDGAKLETGGFRVGDRGNYVAPTVFSNVTDDMPVFREEVFGPVMTINRFSMQDGLDSIIARANDTTYGLAAGIFTTDSKKGHAVMKGVRAGMIFLNCYHVVDCAAPFGGMKESGYGREGGEYGLLPYLEVKMTVESIA